MARFEEKYEEHYGMRFLSFNEEIHLPEAIRSSRNSKHEVIDMCDWMRKMIDRIEYRAKGATTPDDEAHAELVKQFRDMVKRAEIELESAALFGVY